MFDLNTAALCAMLLVSVGTLLAVFGFLLCRTRAMGSGDILLLARLGLHFLLTFRRARAASLEHQAALDDFVNVHCFE